MKLFSNRAEAGQILGSRLAKMNLSGKVCVLALPRGGVPVAAEVANALHCPMDLLFVKKIGAPANEEYAIGAVSEGGVTWREDTIADLGMDREALAKLASAKQRELQIQLQKWRGDRVAVDLNGVTAVVVDDGLATGATMRAAVDFLRSQKPKRIVVGVPVASQTAAEQIAAAGVEFLSLHIPALFFSVGQWYQDFAQVSDADVESALRDRMSRSPRPAEP